MLNTDLHFDRAVHPSAYFQFNEAILWNEQYNPNILEMVDNTPIF